MGHGQPATHQPGAVAYVLPPSSTVAELRQTTCGVCWGAMLAAAILTQPLPAQPRAVGPRQQLAHSAPTHALLEQHAAELTSRASPEQPRIEHQQTEPGQALGYLQEAAELQAAMLQVQVLDG
jgi:hypothetical protein